MNGEDQNGESVLDWARKFKQPEIVSLLQEAGAQGGIELEDLRPSANSAAGSQLKQEIAKPPRRALPGDYSAMP
jgi:ankyrin repeat protein